MCAVDQNHDKTYLSVYYSTTIVAGAVALGSARRARRPRTHSNNKATANCYSYSCRGRPERQKVAPASERSREVEPFVAPRDDGLALAPVHPHAAHVRHEHAGLAGYVGAEVPRVARPAGQPAIRQTKAGVAERRAATGKAW